MKPNRTHSLLRCISSLFLAGLFIGSPSAIALDEERDELLATQFYTLVTGNAAQSAPALQIISDNWRNGDTAVMLEVMHLSPTDQLNTEIVDLLTEKTNKDFGFDIEKWYRWVWENKFEMNSFYPEIKTSIYSVIDDNFHNYFLGGFKEKIRLDEIRWGGVKQDGIPPLRYPTMIPAAEADYLDDQDIIFGLTVNGEARAYPKRIVAWHEMFIDRIAGVEVTGVYCTLCGTMILYDSVADGVHHKLGTSGFLYRSNKLMYDKETDSLWNTFWGEPVIGPLAEQNVKLTKRPIVVTRWGEWKKRHPNTLALSLKTGHRRDYDEGVAYKNYFATDDLMFAVPKLDKRLQNKDEIIGLSLSGETDKPLAISTRFLSKKPIYQDKVGKQAFVVFTDASGASRVYQSKGIQFERWDDDNHIFDKNGRRWRLSENHLTAENDQKLYRIATNRAFWFGWYSAYPQTRLVD